MSVEFKGTGNTAIYNIPLHDCYYEDYYDVTAMPSCVSCIYKLNCTFIKRKKT